MIQILYGPERYKIDMLRAKALKEVPEENQAFDLNRFEGQFSDEVLSACLQPPLFSEKRVVVLDAPDFKAVDTKSFKDYIKAPAKHTDLLVICGKKPDLRTKAVKTYQKQGLFHPCEKCRNEAEFEKILLYEVNKAGAKITESGMKELTGRLSYFDIEDMNLFQAVSYLKQSIDCGEGIVTADAVKEVVPQFEKKDIFATATMLKQGDMDGLLKQARLIPSDEAIGAASALLRDFRLSYKRKYFSLQAILGERAYHEPVFKDTDAAKLLTLMDIVTDEIRGIKEGYVQEDILLQEIFNRTYLALNAPAAEGSVS